MPEVTAYAVADATGPFEKVQIQRREPGTTEVYFAIYYAGICHSDIHTARGEWGPALYPLVPGHEIAGVVKAVGSEVTKFAVGDRVGVGCFVDSCGECDPCSRNLEQFCTGKPGTIWTYNCLGLDGVPTAGGYSTGITVEQDYVCRIPDSMDLAQAAPLLCAGITTYSPLKKWGAGPGKRVAVVGLGGLGHVGVQIAAALGAEVAIISRTLAKQEQGLALGASEYYAASDPQTFKTLRGSFDLILFTISEVDNLNRYLNLLKIDGALVDVGMPPDPVSLRMGALVSGNKVLAGSNIGGIAETQEMLDFCGQHGIGAVIEVIGGEDITEAYDRVVNAQVRFRYVIDTATFDA